MVFERRPLSPSIQTSKDGIDQDEEEAEDDGVRTFCLDLVALVESEVGSKEIVVVFEGHVS